MAIESGRIGYSFCMVLATVVAAWLLRQHQSTLQLTTTQKWGIAIGGFIGATFAAKIPFVLSSQLGIGDGSSGTLNPSLPASTIVGAWLSDGKTVLWGLAGGYIGVEVAKWSLYVRGKTGDSFVIPVAVAIAIGRMGCLFQGCCYGIPTNQSWGVLSMAADQGQLLRHPAPLYETIFHFAFAVLAIYGRRSGILRHQWMLLYLITYSVFRLISETWRAEPVWLAGMTFYQCSAILIGLAFSGVLARRLLGRQRAQVGSVV